jgi:hypothetical protein
MLTVIAVLCQLAGPSCVEEIVTDQAKPLECIMQGQLGVVKWMSDHPRYSHGWRLAGIKCAYGYKPAVPA